jgi:hypothetical protein
MAENTTTLLEKWQKQQLEHPEWTPSLEDLLYFIHGSGRDRDRLFPLSMIYDGSRQIEYLTDSGTLTSEQIVNVYKSGRLPVVRMGGGGPGTQTTLYFYPKSIYYKDEGYGSNINRDCLFFAVTYVKESGEDFYRMKLQIRRYYNIPVQGQGEKTKEQAVDLTCPDSIKIGTKWTLKKVSTQGGEALALALDGQENDSVVFNDDGTKVKFRQQELGLGSWDFVNGGQGSFAIQRTANGETKQAMTTSWNGVVSFPNGVSGHQVSGDLNVSGSISGTIAAKHVDLLSSTANPFDLNTVTGVGNYEPLYVFNEHSGSHSVSFNSGNSVSIGSRKFVVFVKINDLWYVQNDATT